MLYMHTHLSRGEGEGVFNYNPRIHIGFLLQLSTDEGHHVEMFYLTCYEITYFQTNAFVFTE